MTTENLPETTTTEIYQGLSSRAIGLIVTVTLLVVIIIVIIIVVIVCKTSNQIRPSAPSLSNLNGTYQTHQNESLRRQTHRPRDDHPPPYNEVMSFY